MKASQFIFNHVIDLLRTFLEFLNIKEENNFIFIRLVNKAFNMAFLEAYPKTKYQTTIGYREIKLSKFFSNSSYTCKLWLLNNTNMYNLIFNNIIKIHDLKQIQESYDVIKNKRKFNISLEYVSQLYRHAILSTKMENILWVQQEFSEFELSKVLKLSYGVESCSFEMISFLQNNNCIVDDKLHLTAVITGNLEMTKFVFENFKYEQNILYKELKHTSTCIDIDILIYLRSINVYFSEQYLYYKIISENTNSLQKVKKLYENNFRNFYLASQKAVICNNFEVLEWFVETVDNSLNSYVFTSAIIHSDFKIINYLKNKNCPYDKKHILNNIDSEIFDTKKSNYLKVWVNENL